MAARGFRLKGRGALWAAATLLGLVFMGSVLPTPLYGVYKNQFHFSELTLTLVFAAYVAGTLTSLSFFGRLSDQIGRRRVVLPVLFVSAASTFIFLFARNTGMLVVGRILSGVTSGAVAGAATAWVIELKPEGIKTKATVIVVAFAMGGLALGPLIAGLLTQYAPMTLKLTYIVYLPLLATAALLAAATAFAAFALSGFYTALTPSFLHRELHERNHAVSGTIVFELSLFSTLAVLLTQSLKSRAAMMTGMILMLPAVGLLELAAQTRSLWILLGAVAFGGAALATGYRGSLEVINDIAPGEKRAEVTSSYFIVCYVGLSIPVIGVGLLSKVVDPEIADLTFGCVVAAFALVALISGRWSRSQTS